MRSVMSHKFSEVPKANIPRSQFDRSFGYKTTFDAGWLVPFYVDEALPGDTFNMHMTGFARLATPLKPLMDNMYLDTFFFFVPNRIIWSNWKKFNGEQTDPGDSTDFTVPIISTFGGLTENSLFDYMGWPIGADVTSPIQAACLHTRAYNLIWNEFFRDQNMQDSVTVDLDDGPDDALDYVLLRRGKRHDYFTSQLPWPQKGDSVSLPLGTSAPINVGVAEGFNVGLFSDPEAEARLLDPTGSVLTVDNLTASSVQQMYADLSNATAATINELRQAFQVQKLLERDARGGTRYTEVIKAHFGVSSPDARLQRPEYLGGGSTPVNISPVSNTSGNTGGAENTFQGDLAGIGTVAWQGHGFTKSFTEHGVLLGLVSVRADLTYQQGLDRMWSRSTRFDYYWPALSHIGEQVTDTREIFATGVAVADDVVFGYQERYAEYRYKPSKITGLFRSSAGSSLDLWHLSQDFAAAPILDDTFIVENPPIDRVIAVPTEPHFLFDSHCRLKCARPMPVYGVPGLIDHF